MSRGEDSPSKIDNRLSYMARHFRRPVYTSGYDDSGLIFAAQQVLDRYSAYIITQMEVCYGPNWAEEIRDKVVFPNYSQPYRSSLLPIHGVARRLVEQKRAADSADGELCTRGVVSMATASEKAEWGIKVGALRSQVKSDANKYQQLYARWMQLSSDMNFTQKQDCGKYIAQMKQNLEHNQHQVERAQQEFGVENCNIANIRTLFSDIVKESTSFNRTADRLSGVFRTVRPK